MSLNALTAKVHRKNRKGKLGLTTNDTKQTALTSNLMIYLGETLLLIVLIVLPVNLSPIYCGKLWTYQIKVEGVVSFLIYIIVFGLSKHVKI